MIMKTKNYVWYASIALIALLVGLGLFGSMLFFAPTMALYGLTEQAWYVLLMFIGLCAATVSFGFFQSKALYEGQVLNGTLKLGGPIVAMLVVVVLGFWLVPNPGTPFDVTIFLEPVSKAEESVKGRLTLFVGVDPRTTDVGQHGEARFFQVPNNFRAQSVKVRLISDIYEFVDSGEKIILDKPTQTLKVRVKELTLSGIVMDATGPVIGGQVRLDQFSTTTDNAGNFRLTNLPANLSSDQRQLQITKQGYEPYRAPVVLNGGIVHARLDRVVN